MNHRRPSVAIIGGGLAGLAAAVDAVERGFRVELFEQATCLGGRAGSLVDSATGDRIDYCQHVALGCCNRFLDFCRRTGVDDCFARSAALHVIGPDSVEHDLAPSRWLPAPLHLLPGLLGLKYLSLCQRLSIVRTITWLARDKTNSGTIGAWLRRQGQTEQTIERFWSVILVSALGETVDHASLAAARKVFCDGFLGSRRASELVLPQRPLGEIFGDRVGKWLAERGVKLHLATPIRKVEGDGRRAAAIVLADGTRREVNSLVASVPWRNVRPLMAENLLAAMPALVEVERIEPAAITAVHLWFDRPIISLPHAILIGRLGQWIFSDTEPRPAIADPGLAQPTQYCQVVISASHRLAERKHDELVAEVRGELEAIWQMRNVGAAVELPPQRAVSPRLLHGRVITQPAAIFSVQPGMDRFRPPQQTPLGNLALAGDWTATGWPATMEGAIRSGYAAVAALCEATGFAGG
jgi:squalene-associated FAD-dependent desaturase